MTFFCSHFRGKSPRLGAAIIIVQPEQRRADFLKLCDAVTVKPLVTRYTMHKSTAAEYICGCVLCSVAHCCVDWIWRDNISPDLTWVILHHSGSLPCRYVGIPTAVVSGLTLNMTFQSTSLIGFPRYISPPCGLPPRHPPRR